MPKQKDLKRLVRTRMQKTGESYTTARAQLTRKQTPVPTPDLAKLAGMSDDAVRAKTGRTWAQWVKVLDAIDATRLSHRDIAAHVHGVLGVGDWWAQTVTVGYERIRGLREKGQRRGGAFECSKSRTFAAPVETVYRAFADVRWRRKWLGDVAVKVRKATPHKSVRMTWPDDTSVEVWLTPRSTARSPKVQAAVQHSKLAGKDDVARLKAWWHERLDLLSELVEE